MKKNEKGITLISLVVIIILLMILATVSIGIVVKNNKDSKVNVFQSEIRMVQNAVLQRKTRAEITNTDYSELPGINIQKTEVQKILDKAGLVLKGEEGEYKLLDKSSLEELSITNCTDEYIVNYKTGEVINKNKFDTFDEPLYVYSVDN